MKLYIQRRCLMTSSIPYGEIDLAPAGYGYNPDMLAFSASGKLTPYTALMDPNSAAQADIIAKWPKSTNFLAFDGLPLNDTNTIPSGIFLYNLKTKTIIPISIISSNTTILNSVPGAGFDFTGVTFHQAYTPRQRSFSLPSGASSDQNGVVPPSFNCQKRWLTSLDVIASGSNETGFGSEESTLEVNNASRSTNNPAVQYSTATNRQFRYGETSNRIDSVNAAEQFDISFSSGAAYDRNQLDFMTFLATLTGIQSQTTAVTTTFEVSVPELPFDNVTNALDDLYIVVNHPTRGAGGFVQTVPGTGLSTPMLAYATDAPAAVAQNYSVSQWFPLSKCVASGFNQIPLNTNIALALYLPDVGGLKQNTTDFNFDASVSSNVIDPLSHIKIIK